MTSIWLIIPALFLVVLAAYYSQNYAGILASPLSMLHNEIGSYLSIYDWIMENYTKLHILSILKYYSEISN